MELFKQRVNLAKMPQLYYFQDQRGREIDVVYKTGNLLIPMETKSSKTFNKIFYKHLNYFRELVDGRCQRGYAIYAGEAESMCEANCLINYKNVADVFSLSH